MAESPIIEQEQSKNCEKVVLRDKNGRLMKGTRAVNPAGPPKGHRKYTSLCARAIDEAIAKWEETNDASFTEELIDLAISKARKGNMTLLAKIVDKMLPAKIEMKGELEVTRKEQYARIMSRANEILARISSN